MPGKKNKMIPGRILEDPADIPEIISNEFLRNSVKNYFGNIEKNLKNNSWRNPKKNIYSKKLQKESWVVFRDEFKVKSWDEFLE